MEEREEKITFADIMSCLASLREDVRRMGEEIAELTAAARKDRKNSPDARGRLTVEGAAEYLHVSVRTMREYGRTNLIPSERSGKRRLYRKRDLDEYLGRFARMSNTQVEMKATRLVYADRIV